MNISNNENIVKENYVPKLKIKAKRIKLIDSLKSDKYKNKTSQKILEAEITLLNELLKD